MYKERIRRPALLGKVTSAELAARLIQDGMTVGMSGFTRAGDCKAVPLALAAQAKNNPFKITLMTGASLGNDTDKILAEAGVLARRLPFQVDTVLRRKINDGTVMFIDQHLSETAEQLRSQHIGPIDVAVIEAVAITADGGIVPTTSVGNSASFAMSAAKVIVEINLAMPLALEGLHDIYIPENRPWRQPIPLVTPEQRIGSTAIPIDPDRIAAIVFTDKPDSPSTVAPADRDTQAIAAHLTAFFSREVRAGRMTSSLRPLQAGIGTIANAVLLGMVDAPFHGLKMFSEVLQDSTIDLIDAGKLDFASASSMTLSQRHYQRVLDNLHVYRSRLLLRPQEISNHPELIRRLGLIAINTSLECDIYGNINSTHVGGTHMMNGIGGSGDFARNADLAIFVTKSIAKNGNISCIVPMVSHVDHTEHDVDIIVTEQGIADLRGLAPRERARTIIDNCAHPSYRDALGDYYRDACRHGGHTPHRLQAAVAWHVRYHDEGTMRTQQVDAARTTPSAANTQKQAMPIS